MSDTSFHPKAPDPGPGGIPVDRFGGPTIDPTRVMAMEYSLKYNTTENRKAGRCYEHPRRGTSKEIEMPRNYTRIPLFDRFSKYIDKNGPIPSHRPDLGPCWLWTAHCASNGYGSFTPSHLPIGAHRFSYELHVGPIPYGLYVLHHCDVRQCVNPQHLFVGTQKENIDDMIAKGRRPNQANTCRAIQPKALAVLAAHPELRARGERNGSAKLTWDQVREIRQLYEIGSTSYGKLGAQFGVHQSTISLIVKRKKWKE